MIFFRLRSFNKTSKIYDFVVSSCVKRSQEPSSKKDNRFKRIIYLFHILSNAAFILCALLQRGFQFAQLRSLSQNTEAKKAVYKNVETSQ